MVLNPGYVSFFKGVFMSGIYDKLYPKTKEEIFKKYVNVREMQEENEQIKLPKITFSLSNGSTIQGTIIHCDTGSRLISIAVSSQGPGLSVAFIEFNAIVSMTFHEIDLCTEFLNELQK